MKTLMRIFLLISIVAPFQSRANGTTAICKNIVANTEESKPSLDLNYLFESNKELSQESSPLMARVSKLTGKSPRYLAARHEAILRNLLRQKAKLDSETQNNPVALDALASRITFISVMHQLTAQATLKRFFEIRSFYRSQGKALKDRDIVSQMQMDLILQLQNQGSNLLAILRSFENTSSQVDFQARSTEGLLALVETGATPQQISSLYRQFTRHDTQIQFAMQVSNPSQIPFLMRAVLQSAGTVTVEQASLAYSFVFKTLIDSIGFKKAVGVTTGAEYMGQLAEAFVNSKISQTEFSKIVKAITSNHVQLSRRSMIQGILAELGYPYL